MDQATPIHESAAGMQSAALHARTPEVQQDVGEHRMFDAPLSDEAREIAIVRAGKLVEFFMGEHDAARRRYAASSHLADKGDADGALLNAQQAQSLMLKLIRGRSPEQILRMAVAQAGRMAREPGATTE